MPQVEPTPAVHLRDLPQDARGYRVPAEAPWTSDGLPHLSKIDPVMKVILAGYRACAVCGFQMLRNEPVCRIHDEFSRGMVLGEMRDGAVSENDPPGHLVCMLYSALVCPFWRTPGGRLGQDSQYEPGGRRGERPSILAFLDYSILVDPVQHLGGEGHPVSFRYRDYLDEIEFKDPSIDLEAAYHRERQRVGGKYVRGKRRHYGPTFGGAKRLVKEGALVSQELLAGGRNHQIATLEGRQVWHCSAGWASGVER